MLNIDLPVCPITQQEIKEPVIDREGNTYEKQAILEWLETNNISPLTRNRLTSEDLQPNRAYIEIIELLTQQISNVSISTDNSCKFVKCSICRKDMKVSTSYKGKKSPKCFKCRPWNCKLCTFENNPNLNYCEMCENPK